MAFAVVVIVIVRIVRNVVHCCNMYVINKDFAALMLHGVAHYLFYALLRLS